MKAISLWQPWASAIAVGAKTIETRGWFTGYRGQLAIHAAKKDMPELRDFFTWQACALVRAEFATFDELPLGAIVAVCELKECLRTTDIDGLTRQERDFGDFSPGRYGWVLANIVRLEKPVPFRGAQQLFDVPDGLLAQQVGLARCKMPQERQGRLPLE